MLHKRPLEHCEFLNYLGMLFAHQAMMVLGLLLS